MGVRAGKGTVGETGGYREGMGGSDRNKHKVHEVNLGTNILTLKCFLRCE